MSNVFIRHTRGLGYCRKGVKIFMERNGFDWNKFLSEGIPEEEIMKIDDIMAKETVNFMRKESNV